jgi:hypothetical protein
MLQSHGISNRSEDHVLGDSEIMGRRGREGWVEDNVFLCLVTFALASCHIKHT